MDTIPKLIFYNIARYLSQKELINLCKTRVAFKKIFEEDYFQEQYFKSYKHINSVKFDKMYLIEKLIDNQGNLFKYNIMSEDITDIKCQASNVISSLSNVIKLTNDGSMHYLLINKLPSGSLIEKYYLKCNKTLSNILNFYSTNHECLILTKDFRFFEISKCQNSLDLISNNVKEIGANIVYFYYITKSNSLYVKYLFDFQDEYHFISHNIKFVIKPNINDDMINYVDISNNHFSISFNMTTRKFINYHYKSLNENIINLTYYGDKFLIHKENLEVIYDNVKLDKKFIKISDHYGFNTNFTKIFNHYGIDENLNLFKISKFSQTKIASNVINFFCINNDIYYITL